MALIKRLAHAGCYSFRYHADEREDERTIDDADVLRALTRGHIPDRNTIVPGRRAGEWKCAVESSLPWTPRTLGVVTVVIRKERLLIITVEWMDR